MCNIVHQSNEIDFHNSDKQHQKCAFLIIFYKMKWFHWSQVLTYTWVLPHLQWSGWYLWLINFGKHQQWIQGNLYWYADYFTYWSLVMQWQSILNKWETQTQYSFATDLILILKRYTENIRSTTQSRPKPEKTWFWATIPNNTDCKSFSKLI